MSVKSLAFRLNELVDDDGDDDDVSKLGRTASKAVDADRHSRLRNKVWTLPPGRLRNY